MPLSYKSLKSSAKKENGSLSGFAVREKGCFVSGCTPSSL